MSKNVTKTNTKSPFIVSSFLEKSPTLYNFGRFVKLNQLNQRNNVSKIINSKNFFEKITKHKWTLEWEGHDELKINLHQFGTGIQKQGI